MIPSAAASPGWRALVALVFALAGTAWLGHGVLHAGWTSVPSALRFRHLTVEQGLSVSIVRAVLQDSKGFLWIGTQDGLNMYDGFRVTVFKHEPDDDNSLPGSYVTSLAETGGPSGRSCGRGRPAASRPSTRLRAASRVTARRPPIPHR